MPSAWRLPRFSQSQFSTRNTRFHTPPAASVEGWPVRYRIIVCLPLALYPSCRCCTSQSQGFSSIPISYFAKPRSGLDEFVLRIPVPHQKAPGTQCSWQRLCSGLTTVKCFYSGLCAAQSLSQPCCTCVATFKNVVDAANAFFSSEGSQTKLCLARPFVLATVPPERNASCFFPHTCPPCADGGATAENATAVLILRSCHKSTGVHVSPPPPPLECNLGGC